MPTATIDVDTQVYTDAATAFLQANGKVCDIVAEASVGAQWARGMAGTDSNGAQWAVAYDAAAVAILQAGTKAVDALGRIGQLLAGSGDNHAAADSGAAGGPPVYPGQSGPPCPQSVIVAPPPSADGTPSDPPPGWSLVAHLLAWTWPNGHQDQLRAVAASWARAGEGLQDAADGLSAPIGEISALRSPEVAAAVGKCTDVQLSVRRLAAACLQLSGMCTSYADRLDETHSTIERQLIQLVVECAAIEAAGAALAAVTAGGSEAAAQNSLEIPVGLAAVEIAVWLERLAGVVDALANILRDVVAGVVALSVSLDDILDRAVLDGLVGAVVLAEKADLAAQLATAPVWAGSDSKFPSDGPPGGIRVKRDPSGRVSNYAVYDDDGLIVRRVDLTGKSHNGVPTPHVVDYEHNRDPQTGKVWVKERSWDPRPATASEVP